MATGTGLWSTKNDVAITTKAQIVDQVPQLPNREGANAEADINQSLEKLKQALNNFDNPLEDSNDKVSTIFDASSDLGKVKDNIIITVETMRKENGGKDCKISTGDLMKLRDDRKRANATVSGMKMGLVLGCIHVFGNSAYKVVHDDEGMMKELDTFTLEEVEEGIKTAAIRIPEKDKIDMKIKALKLAPNYQQPLSAFATALDKETQKCAKSGVPFGPEDKSILMLAAVENATRHQWGQTLGKANDELRAAYTSEHIHDKDSYQFIQKKIDKAEKNRILADAPVPDVDSDEANEANEADGDGQGWAANLFDVAYSGSESSVDSRRTNRTRSSKKSVSSTRSYSRHRGYNSDSGSETSSERTRDRRTKTKNKVDRKRGTQKICNPECVWCNVVGQTPPHPKGVDQESCVFNPANINKAKKMPWAMKRLKQHGMCFNSDE